MSRRRRADEPDCAIRVSSPVTVEMNQFSERNKLFPSLDFEFRPAEEFIDIAETEIRHRVDLWWDQQRLSQLHWIDNAYPTHADAFGSRCRHKFCTAQTEE